MAKKWADFTKREKTIGVLVAVFSVMTIGGIAGAAGDTPAATNNLTPTTQTKVVAPVVTYKEVQETEIIPFSKENRDDSSRNAGTSVVTTSGVDGLKTKTFKVTLTEGTETNKELLNEVVTTEPVAEVTSVGTYVAPVKATTSQQSESASNVYYKNCTAARAAGAAPVYRGQPGYGSHLDRDNDGVGCE